MNDIVSNINPHALGVLLINSVLVSEMLGHVNVKNTLEDYINPKEYEYELRFLKEVITNGDTKKIKKEFYPKEMLMGNNVYKELLNKISLV